MTATIEAPTPVSLPKPIERKLGGLRGHLRRIDLALGLTRLAIVVVAFVAGTFVLDRSLDLPMAFRLVLLALGGAAALFVTWRWILVPLAVRRTDDEMALLVERAHPELNDELISAVQLSRASGGGAVHSREMVAQVIQDAAARTDRIDFSRVADTADLKRLLFLTIACAAIIGGLFASRQRDARIWFERMILLRDTAWPRTVELEVETSAKIIARGDDVSITARVLRGTPTRVAVLPRFESASRSDEVPMVEARGEWRATFENVNDSFKFYVEGGDYRSKWYEVLVRPRPKLEEVRIWLEHPGYTGIPATPKDEPLRDGNLKVPQGTLVRYEALASEPLKEAEASFAAPQALTDAKAAAIGGDGKDAGKVIRGEFRVKDSTAWTMRLVSAEGFESPAAAQYQIRAIPDRLPDVRVPKPGRNKDVTRAAAVPLRVEVKDDYLPRAAALAYVVQRAKRRTAEGAAPEAPAAAPAAEETRVALKGLPSGDEAKSVTIEHAFELGGIQLEAGDRITYWVEAVDNRAPLPDVLSVPAESRGKSERYQLSVVADEELERALQGALKRVGEDLVGLVKTEQVSIADLEQLAQEVGARDKPDIRDKKKLTYAELDQRKVGQSLERARKTFADVREEMAANKLGKDEDQRAVGELEAQTRALNEGQVARATQELQQLRQAEKVDPAKILDVTRKQRDVVEELNRMIAELQKRDDAYEAERGLQDLIRQQERIKEDTVRRAKEEPR